MAELIQRTDDLNTGREKLNEAIKDADKAKIDAEQALNTANEALSQSESTQIQLNQVVIDGDSSVEAAQARVDAENNVFATLKERLDTKEQQFKAQFEQINQKIIDEEITVHIPSDYATLQEAIDDLSNKFISQKVLINLNIESGHKPSSGIVLLNRDCANFRITSEDPVVTVANDFEGDFIRGENSRLPILACLIDMNDLGEDGYHVSKNSSGRVEVGCGIRNAGGRGLYVNEGSSVEARGSEFVGCNDRNVWVSRASTLSAELSNFSANKGGENAIYVSRASTANLLDCDVSNAFQNAIAVIRSVVNCEGANVSEAGATGVIVQRGSRVAAEFVDATNCGVNGIRYETGSTGSCRGSNASGAGAIGIWVRHGSNVNALEAIANNCGADGIRAEDGSNVNARQAECMNNNNFDLSVIGGSFMNAHLTRTTSGTPNIADCRPLAFNSFDGRHGVIFADNSPN